MIVTKRLQEVGNYIDDDTSILDIGCDHAFLDIYLREQKNRNFKKIVASDNKEGPLEQAKKHINEHKLNNKIELRLGDGLDVYTSDIDTIVISGMGGRNMIGIFKKHPECFKTIDTLILSPNNYQADVRKYLTEMGYVINDENIIKDGKYFYQIMKLKKGKQKYSKKELFFGPILLQKKEKNFYAYYGKELMSRQIILQLLPKGFSFRKLQLKKEIKLIKEEM